MRSILGANLLPLLIKMPPSDFARAGVESKGCYPFKRKGFKKRNRQHSGSIRQRRLGTRRLQRRN